MAPPTAAKRTRPRPAKVAPLTGDFEPVRIETRSEPVPVERVPLFYLDDVEYTVPTVIPRSVSFKVLKTLRASGEAAAGQHALELLLGEEGYEALTSSDDISDEQFEQIMQIAASLVFGSQGKGSPGSGGR